MPVVPPVNNSSASSSGSHFDRRARGVRVLLEQIAHPQIARLEFDAMTFLLFLREREQQAQQRRQILFDVRRNNPLELRVGLDRFDLVVKRREDDDRIGAAFIQREFEFALGVNRIERRGDRSGFPRAQSAR